MSQGGALRIARLRDSKGRDVTTSPDGVRVQLDTTDARTRDLLGAILLELTAIRLTLAKTTNTVINPEDL